MWLVKLSLRNLPVVVAGMPLPTRPDSNDSHDFASKWIRKTLKIFE